jgi:hypothetical protein
VLDADRSDLELVAIALQDDTVVHPRSPRELSRPEKERPPRIGQRALTACRAPSRYGSAISRSASPSSTRFKASRASTLACDRTFVPSAATPAAGGPDRAK